MHSILIVKTSAIGDVIHAFPVLEYLRERFPGVSIDWVVEKGLQELVAAHPLIERVLVVDTKRWRKQPFSKTTREEFKKFYHELRRQKYHFLFDLQGNSKSALITALAQAEEKVGFGWRSLPEKPNFFVTDYCYELPDDLPIRQRYLALVRAHLKDQTPYAPQELVLQEVAPLERHPCLMVAFGSKWKNKQLKEETLVEFLNLIYEQYGVFFLFHHGNEEERACAERLHVIFPNSLLLGELSLPLWQGWMQRVDGLIAMDSAALHLCATTKTPTFSLFGPSSASIYKPEGEQHVAYQGSCPYGQVFMKRCPILRTCPTGSCLQDIAAKDLFAAFKDWWQN